jgi:acetyl esterase/lipase
MTTETTTTLLADPPPPPGGRRPRDDWFWALTVAGVVLLLVTLVASFYMLHRVEYRGVGMIGVYATMFAPQLLVVTVAAAFLASISRWRRARVAAAAFRTTALLTLVMAVWPTSLQYLRARHYRVPVSFHEMLVPRLQPRGASPKRTVTYATAPDGTRLRLDVWRAPRAAGGELRPAMIRVHGGGWAEGSRGEMLGWVAWLNQLGYDVFDIDYRLPPPARWRDEVGDVKCAISWVATRAGALGIDPARISLMGYSTGGNLVLLAAATMGDPRFPPSCPGPAVKLRSVVNLYGPTDMARMYARTPSSFARPMMRSYVGGRPSDLPDRYRLLSPLTHVNPRMPPTLTVHGEADRVVRVEQAVWLDQALTEQGVYREMYRFPWSDHGFDAVWSSFATQVVRAKLRAFLQRHG